MGMKRAWTWLYSTMCGENVAYWPTLFVNQCYNSQQFALNRHIGYGKDIMTKRDGFGEVIMNT